LRKQIIVDRQSEICQKNNPYKYPSDIDKNHHHVALKPHVRTLADVKRKRHDPQIASIYYDLPDHIISIFYIAACSSKPLVPFSFTEGDPFPKQAKTEFKDPPRSPFPIPFQFPRTTLTSLISITPLLPPRAHRLPNLHLRRQHPQIKQVVQRRVGRRREVEERVCAGDGVLAGRQVLVLPDFPGAVDLRVV
jgi:hypothetical protein